MTLKKIHGFKSTGCFNRYSRQRIIFVLRGEFVFIEGGESHPGIEGGNIFLSRGELSFIEGGIIKFFF